jgi:hypothetical protein
LAEKICLDAIAQFGLKAVDGDLTSMATATFDDVPDWTDLLNSTHTCRLFLPTAYNYRAIDGAILFVDRNAKRAHLYPLQVTLSMRDRDSDEDFYTNKWWEWIKRIEDGGFQVQSTFVWIDQKQPSQETKSEKKLHQ